MTQQKPSAWHSILAGGTAGGLETLITPTEFIKTGQRLSGQSSQSNTPRSIFLQTLKNEGIRPMYTGVGVFCLSNTSKPAVRFTTFDIIVRSRLPTDIITGKPTALSNMIAGACAGAAENLTVLTPGENLKTKLIDGGSLRGSLSRLSARQLLSRTLAHEGLRGLYCGAVPVTMKQSANAIVRFTSYQYLLDGTKSTLAGQNVQSRLMALAIAGGMAGVVTVYATMPFDNIKTKMQSLEGGVAYRGSSHCIQEIVGRDGLKALWTGISPRLIRLTVTVMLAFSINEQAILLTMQERQHRGMVPVSAAPA